MGPVTFQTVSSGAFGFDHKVDFYRDNRANQTGNLFLRMGPVLQDVQAVMGRPLTSAERQLATQASESASIDLADFVTPVDRLRVRWWRAH